MLVLGICLTLLFRLHLSFFCCSLICPLLCWLIVVWQFMPCNCSHLPYGIPVNAGPLSGITKKLHWFSMPLLIIVTLHIPMCGIQVLWYTFSTIFIMDWFSSFMSVHGKGILYILGAIKLPSLSVSILYSHISIFKIIFIITDMTF